MLSASPYQNAANHYDVNADGVSDGVDIWDVDQLLRANGEGRLPNPNGPVPNYPDVDGDYDLDWVDEDLLLRHQTNTPVAEALKKSGGKTSDSGGVSLMTVYTVTLNPTSVNEGSAFSQTGYVSPPGTYFFQATMNWGTSPGSGGPPVMVMTNSSGQFSIPHIYFDDGASPGNGTPSDVETVTLSGSIMGQPVSAQTTVTVQNVNPSPQVTLTNTNTPFGGPRWQVGGTIQDASMTDKHNVTIDWGDGSQPTYIPNVSTNVHFDSPQHEYPTNNESGVPTTFQVTIKIDDDDRGTAQTTLNAPVYLFDLDNDANDDQAINAADESIENTYPGRLMFVNSDDDNQNCTVDAQENPVNGEDDLVPFLVRWQAVARPELQNYVGWRIALSMDPGQTALAKVWETDDKTGQIIFDQVTDYGFAKIWTVGGTEPIPSQLFLEATSTGGIELNLAFYTPAPAWTLASLDEVVFTAIEQSSGAVNLTIYDGNEGFPAIDEDVTGAVTVANINNTDADSMIDNVDTDGVLDPDGTPGRNEVDLMKLVVHRPTNYAGGPVLLVAQPPSRVRLWEDPHKEHPASEYDPATGIAFIDGWNQNCGHRIVWVEIISQSQAVADITISAQYGGASDSVKATGVWATNTAVEVADKDWDPDLLGTTWDKDMDEYLQYVVSEAPLGGTGKRPRFFDGLSNVQNVMLMRFTVTPEHVQELLPRVQFDIARRIEEKVWNTPNGQNNPQPFQTPWHTYPTEWEKANDDPDNPDESSRVLDNPQTPEYEGYMFVFDAPGWFDVPSAEIAGYYQAWAYFNFEEFMRVDFKGVAPGGNTISGTASSPYYLWHSRASILWNYEAEIWERMTIGGQNMIGGGNPALPNSP